MPRCHFEGRKGKANKSGMLGAADMVAFECKLEWASEHSSGFRNTFQSAMCHVASSGNFLYVCGSAKLEYKNQFCQKLIIHGFRMQFPGVPVNLSAHANSDLPLHMLLSFQQSSAYFSVRAFLNVIGYFLSRLT